MNLIQRQPDVLSPELALVDPELGRVARVLLPDSAEARIARPAACVPIGAPLFGRRTWRHSARPRGSRHSRRMLVGVAAATMLVFLLIGVRAEFRRGPTAADSSSLAPDADGGARGASVPAAEPPSRPSSTKRPFRTTDRRFAWAPVSAASGYHVEFFRGATRVFTSDTTHPFITVPAKWTLAGSRHSLRPGAYRWYVWPIVEGRRQALAVVQASISIP